MAILFEATGIYSYHLKPLCAEHKIKAGIINLQASHNFAKSTGKHSKTDTIDARTIWTYPQLIQEKDIRISQVAPGFITLSSYLASYQLTLKLRLSLTNYLEGVKDKELID